jgi:hypothetical protein
VLTDICICQVNAFVHCYAAARKIVMVYDMEVFSFHQIPVLYCNSNFLSDNKILKAQ